MALHVDRYRSIQELTAVRVSPCNEIIETGIQSHNKPHSNPSDWFGVGSTTEVERLTQHGWVEGREQILSLGAKIKSKIPAIKASRRRAFRGMQGDELDIHSVRNGNLDRAWRYTKRVEAGGKGRSKKIRIFVGLGGNCNLGADSLFWSPAAAMIVAEALIKARFAVEIVAGNKTERLWTRVKTDHMSLIRIKSFDQPANPDSLAILALAGFFRVFCFRSMASHPTLRVNRSLGSQRAVTDEDLSGLSSTHATLIASHLFTEKDAINWAEKSLQEVLR